MIWPLPRTGPSSRCRLQLMTKIRLSSFSRDASEIEPSASGSSVSPSPRNAQTFWSDGRLQAAVLQVPREPRLVDRHQRAEAHRDRREFPEVRHQPRMRIRRQAAVRPQLVTEVAQVRFGEPAFEKRARVDARRRVALEVDDVGVAAGVLAAEEVIERDLVERRRRGVGRDVAADAVRLAIGAHDHRQRVPADQALDAALDLAVARIRHLLVGGDRVDVGRGRRERHADAGLRGRGRAARRAAASTRPLSPCSQDVVERLEPLAGFDGLEGGGVGGCDVLHDGCCPWTSIDNLPILVPLGRPRRYRRRANPCRIGHMHDTCCPTALRRSPARRSSCQLCSS